MLKTSFEKRHKYGFERATFGKMKKRYRVYYWAVITLVVVAELATH